MKPKACLLGFCIAVGSMFYFGYRVGRWGSDISCTLPIHSMWPFSQAAPPQGAATPTSKQRQAARLALVATDDMRRQGLLATKKGLRYHTIGDDGMVSDAALIEANIPTSRKPEVQALLDELWNKLSVDFASRICPDDRRSSADRSIRSYLVYADPSGGASRVETFHAAISAQFGQVAADTLIEGLGVQFARFGKSDLRISFADGTDPSGSKVANVSYEVIDPDSGSVVGGGHCCGTLGLFSVFGTSFDDIEPGSGQN